MRVSDVIWRLDVVSAVGRWEWYVRSRVRWWEPAMGWVNEREREREREQRLMAHSAHNSSFRELGELSRVSWHLGWSLLSLWPLVALLAYTHSVYPYYWTSLSGLSGPFYACYRMDPVVPGLCNMQERLDYLRIRLPSVNLSWLVFSGVRY